LDEYHKSLYRKQKDEKLKTSVPSKSEQAGKADRKRHEQDGKTAVAKSKHQQEEAQDVPAVLERPKSAARTGIRPSTRFVLLHSFRLSSNASARGGPAERAAAEEKERLQRQAEQEAERARHQMQEEAEHRRQEALAAAEELKKKVWKHFYLSQTIN
jgi:hypothetical protein